MDAYRAVGTLGRPRRVSDRWFRRAFDCHAWASAGERTKYFAAPNPDADTRASRHPNPIEDADAEAQRIAEAERLSIPYPLALALAITIAVAERNPEPLARTGDLAEGEESRAAAR